MKNGRLKELKLGMAVALTIFIVVSIGFKVMHKTGITLDPDYYNGYITIDGEKSSRHLTTNDCRFLHNNKQIEICTSSALDWDEASSRPGKSWTSEKYRNLSWTTQAYFEDGGIYLIAYTLVDSTQGTHPVGYLILKTRPLNRPKGIPFFYYQYHSFGTDQYGSHYSYKPTLPNVPWCEFMNKVTFGMVEEFVMLKTPVPPSVYCGNIGE